MLAPEILGTEGELLRLEQFECLKSRPGVMIAYTHKIVDSVCLVQCFVHCANCNIINSP